MAGRAGFGRRLRGALATAAAGLLGALAIPAATAVPAGADTTAPLLPSWMIRSTAVGLINGYLGNDTLTTSAFDVPTSLETSAPHNWLSQGVQTYDAYGPATAPGSLLYALDNGKVPSGVSYLLYDDEAWAATPVAEQQDPGLYMALFVSAAHASGYGVILAPAVDLATSMPCYKTADPDWADYLSDCSLPRLAGEAGADVVELQAQRFEDNTSAGSGCGCYAWFVAQAAGQVRAVDPFAEVYAGLASDHSGVVSTPQTLYADTLATRGSVDGYWLNVPQQSGACPSCTPGGAPQVAAGYLWLLGYAGAGSQTITLHPPPGATVGTTATLTATGGPSGNPVVFSVDGTSTPLACRLSGPNGTTVTYTAAGTCVIDADQAGAVNWLPAAEVKLPVTVAPGSQAITFSPPATAVVGTTASLAATGGASGNPVVFAVDPSSTSGACTVSGSTLSFTAAGACIVDAGQAGDADWNAAPQVMGTVAVGPGSQVITLAPPAPAAVGTSATLAATGGPSGEPVVFSVDPASPPGVCSVSGDDGATVTYGATGTCRIDAGEGGDANWQAAPQVSEVIPVGPGAQAITFAAPGTGAGSGRDSASGTGSVGTSVTLTATGGGSTSPVVYTIDPSSGSGVCSVSSATLTFGGVGTCVVDANQAGDANWDAAPQVSVSIAVGPGSQAIIFAAPAAGAVGTSVTLTATGGGSTSPVVYAIDPASGAGVCSVAGAIVTFGAAGSCVLDADQPGDANWEAAPEVVQTIAVGQGSQTITFSPPAVALYGTSLTLAAAGGASGNPVTFSVDPGAGASAGAGACELDGATLTFTGIGICTIEATQAGDADYAEAAPVTRSITVGLDTQSIELGPPPAAAVGTTAVLSASGGGSGNPVTFVVDAASGAGVCSLSGPGEATVTFSAAGACVVDANEAGDADFLPAATLTETITVARGAQAIGLPAWPEGQVGSSGTLWADGGGSTSPVVFSVDPSSGAGVCTVAGGVVSFGAAGFCVVDADQAGDANFLPAPRVTGTIAVARGGQAISFDPPATGAVGTTTLLTAIGGASGLPVTFSVDPSSGAGTCTISGSAVTFGRVGTCVVDAEQAGDADWLPAPAAVATVAVGPGSQVVTFSLPAAATFASTLTLSASGGASGLPVTFAVDASSAAGACAVAGTGGAALSLTGVGACVVDATEEGDGDWLPAPQVAATVTVTPAPQAITFTSGAPADAVFGGGGYSATATGGGSGNAVTFSSATPDVCRLAGDAVSFVGVGTCTVLADQAGDVDYQAAPEASQSFRVQRAPQAVRFTSTAPTGAVYRGPTYIVAATGGASGRPLTFASGTPAVCTVTGAAVTFVGVGTCTIDADQLGTADYAPAPQAVQAFTVSRAPQRITFTSAAPANARYAGPSYAVTATGGASGHAVTFASDRTSVCTVSGGTVRFVGVGTCTVEADQAGSTRYAPAPVVRQSFVVYKSPQSFVITSKPAAKPLVGDRYTVMSTIGASGTPVVFASGTPSVCTVAGAVVSFVHTGTCTVVAGEAASPHYYAAPTQRQSFGVSK